MFTGKIGKLDGWDGSPFPVPDATSPMAPLRLGSGAAWGKVAWARDHEARDHGSALIVCPCTMKQGASVP